VRCPHRSFISNKKLPVLGSYYSNDKRNCFYRKLSTDLPKTETSKIVGIREGEAIPTELIQIPIGKAEELHSNLVESAVFSDINRLTQSMRSLSPVAETRNARSLSSSRLSDHLSISVYKSPDTIVAAPIISGPRLTKDHVLRVSGEGRNLDLEASYGSRQQVDLQLRQNPYVQEANEYHINVN